MPEAHEILIIGAGLSGLSVAHFLAQQSPQREVLILEQDTRPGGAVRSFHEAGYLAEWGPHGFLDNNPASRRLLVESGLDPVALKAPLGSFVRHVCHQGRLVQLPQKPPSLLSTPLLSPLGKLRLAGDLLIKSLAREQSVAEWAGRRFGREVLPLVDAAITGTFAGDYQRLSIDAVMPGVRLLEKQEGSVLRGLLKKKKMGTTGQLPAMTSFPGGMEQLIHALAQRPAVRFQTAVQHIAQRPDGWEVETNDRTYHAQSIVLALPVNQTLRLLAGHQPPLSSLPTASIATVVLGYPDQARIPAGFGYLAPEREERFSLGALFSSNMFPGRAPAGHVLLEALVGGRRHPERLSIPDQELTERVHADLGKLMHLPAPPAFSRVLRGNHAIPQLEMGYPRLLSWKNNLEATLPGLHICGFGWEGIGMNDMIKAASTVAEQIQHAAVTKATPEVRPVYF